MLPTLIHAVSVGWEYRDDTSAAVDAGEDVVRGSGRLAEVILPGQVTWETMDRANPLYKDVTASAAGHVTVRPYDFARRTLRLPARGDRLSSVEGDPPTLNGVPARLYVIHTEPCGHYRPKIGPQLLRVFFSDREMTG